MLTVKSLEFKKESFPEDLFNSSQTATFFQSFDWFSLFLKHFSTQILILGIFDKEKLLAVGPFSIFKKSINFLGTTPVLNNQLVTDFGDLICLPNREKEVWKNILKFFKENYQNYKLELNFLRQNSPSYKVLSAKPGLIETDTAPFLVLPKSWKEYLSSLPHHQRHELKRKLKKSEGQVFLEINSQPDSQAIEEFFRLMSLSEDQKSVFLTTSMKEFFKSILQTFYPKKMAGLAFLKRQNQNLAAELFFDFKNQILLYNAGFDINYKDLSPGLVLSALMIKKAIEDKKEIVDFLRGNERYKYDLGAKDNKLYKLAGQL